MKSWVWVEDLPVEDNPFAAKFFLAIFFKPFAGSIQGVSTLSRRATNAYHFTTAAGGIHIALYVFQLQQW
jgi:hypothetical protein